MCGNVPRAQHTRGKVRCAIVGLGRIGSLLEEDRLREKPCTHAGAVSQSSDCVLVGGCDIDERRCKTFSERWKCPYTCEDVGMLLEETSPDILHIATPPQTHFTIVKKTLGSSVRVIICEKPLAPTSSEALAIAEIHRSGEIKIITNHERRYSKDYLMTKGRIKNGYFGELLSINAKLYMGERIPVEEQLLGDGTHLVDIVNFLTSSELKPVSAWKLLHESGESLCISGSGGGVPVLMEVGSGRNHVVFELDLSFTAGRIRIGNGLYEEYRSEESSYYEDMRSLMKRTRRRPKVTGYFTNMLDDAVGCFREKDKVPRSSAWDGYLAVKFIDEVKKSLK